MAIYHYVSSKERLLDALVDCVFREIHRPSGDDWRGELMRRCTSMREALARHRWVLPVIETRAQPGPATLASHEAVLDVLRRSGMSLQAAAHAYVVLDAFVFGFALQESMLETVGLPDAAGVAEAMDLGRYPRVAELAAMYVEASVYPLTGSFDVGLSLVFDGIERLAEAFPEPEVVPTVRRELSASDPARARGTR
jgi:AcrR family transcriptional regulator